MLKIVPYCALLLVIVGQRAHASDHFIAFKNQAPLPSARALQPLLSIVHQPSLGRSSGKRLLSRLVRAHEYPFALLITSNEALSYDAQRSLIDSLGEKTTVILHRADDVDVILNILEDSNAGANDYVIDAAQVPPKLADADGLYIFGPSGTVIWYAGTPDEWFASIGEAQTVLRTLELAAEGELRAITSKSPSHRIGPSARSGQPTHTPSPHPQQASTGSVAHHDYASSRDTLEPIDKLLQTTDGRAVLINLWATWCPACKYEMPQLTQIVSEYSRTVRYVGLLTQSLTPGVLYEMKQMCPSSLLNKQYGIVDESVVYTLFPNTRGHDIYRISVPRFALLDRDGRVLLTLEGALGSEGGEAKLRAALTRLGNGEPK